MLHALVIVVDFGCRWFHTGDVAQWTQGGRLQIIDRKKVKPEAPHLPRFCSEAVRKEKANVLDVSCQAFRMRVRCTARGPVRAGGYLHACMHASHCTSVAWDSKGRRGAT